MTTGTGGTMTTGTGGTMTTGTGGTMTTGTGGTMTTGAGGSSGDVNCTSTNAKTGMACTVDCILPCGYQGIGTKTCTCTNGAYSMCPCPRPASFMGAATAPTCASVGSPDGTAAMLKNMACTTQWAECIGSDLVSGSTPQGCVCMLNATSNTMQWVCASTNKWFTAM
jgi:hypothetical protein